MDDFFCKKVYTDSQLNLNSHARLFFLNVLGSESLLALTSRYFAVLLQSYWDRVTSTQRLLLSSDNEPI